MTPLSSSQDMGSQLWAPAFAGVIHCGFSSNTTSGFSIGRPVSMSTWVAQSILSV